MVQINQGNVGSSIHVSIQNGILTMPDGSSIDLKEIQLALNDAFQETGEHDLMKACNQMSKLTLLEVGPNRELLPSTESENLARKSRLTVQAARWSKQETFPITTSGELKSISDDDLCSSCANCDYKPGELSSCFKNWPGSEDADGYVQTCKEWSNEVEGNVESAKHSLCDAAIEPPVSTIPAALTPKLYRVAVYGGTDLDVSPSVAVFQVDELLAREILRFASLVRANDLYKIERFDYRAEFLQFDPVTEPEDADQAGQDNYISTECETLVVTDCEFFFCAYVKHTDVGVESSGQSVADLAKHFGLQFGAPLAKVCETQC